MENRTQKILHIIDTLNIGGAEKLLVGVVNGLPQYRHFVVYLHGDGLLLPDLPTHCRVIKLKCNSKLDIPRCVLQLRRIIKRESIDIVHSHLFFSTLIARLACPSSCRLITTLHNVPGKIRYNRSRLVRFLDKLTYRKRHEIIAVSEQVFEMHDSIMHFSGTCWVLTNFVEDVFYQPTYKRMNVDGVLRLVAVGNLKSAKNYSFLLEAFSYLSPAFHLDIYGSGELRESLQHKIDERKLPVRLCGERNNIHELLPEYDAFLMGSLYEGNPLALLEAMASGIPVILSDIPSLRKVTGNDAVYFKLDNPYDLANQLIKISEGKIDLDNIARANHEKVRQTASKQNYLRRLSSIYANQGDVKNSLIIQKKIRQAV
jgi:glycosyltransferase involved in cell wall biosynthesis